MIQILEPYSSAASDSDSSLEENKIELQLQ